MVADLGLDVPVLVRTAPQLRQGARSAIPSPPTASTRRRSTSRSWPIGPRRERWPSSRALTGQFGADRFEMSGSHVYLHCPGGYGETKLNNTYLERRLGTTATTRNWRTVTTLAELAGLAR